LPAQGGFVFSARGVYNGRSIYLIAQAVIFSYNLVINGSTSFHKKGGLLMKIEIGDKKPEFLKDVWPGQYSFFSYFEYLCGIPHSLFLITTLKENGRPNVCFHSWSSFSGDGEGFYAVMPGLGQHTHTYKNILRTKEFCINFISPKYYDACIKTISDNDEADEFAIGGFTREASASIEAPRIKESFLSLECKYEMSADLSKAGTTALVVGKVIHIAADEEYSKGMDNKYGRDGFMLNIHSPKDLLTGEGETSGIAVLDVIKTFA
jgi:flavin reductase (DIM6/NTAB) family NADH-FMN oxidoreductase RutF